MKKILFFILTLALTITLAACGKKDNKTTDLVKDSDWKTPGMLIDEYQKDDKEVTTVRFTIAFKNDDGISYKGYMTFLLFNELAPVSVNNFVKLTEKGFYDNLTITRIVTTDLIQGGDPEKTTLSEKKDSQNTIKGEFEENEVFNNLSHRRGVLSMARADDPNSASSQFFVVKNTFTSADGSYAAFGWLLEEKKEENGNYVNYTMNERTNTKDENGVRILYDYDLLDEICKLQIVNDVNDGAPVTTVEIVKAEVIDKDAKISTIKYI